MIASAGASTSTVLLTNGIARAYRLVDARLFEQGANHGRDRHGPAVLPVDVDVHPVADGRYGFAGVTVLPQTQPVRDAAVAQPCDRHTDEKWLGETQFGEVLASRL